MKKLLHQLVLLSMLMVTTLSISATETINLQGTVYSLDTIFHAKVGPGTTQTHLELLSGTKQLQVFYLTVDKTTPGVSMRAVCSKDMVAGTEKVTTMAKRKSTDGVLYFAGTNADFFTTSGNATNGSSKIGSPTTSCTVDREIYKTSNSNYQFTIDTANVARIGRLNYYTGTATIGEKVTLFKGVNVASPNNGITLYTHKYWGSTNQTDKAGSCAEVKAKLVEGEKFLAGTKFKLIITGEVTTDGDTPISDGEFVIHGRGTSTSGCNTGALDFVSALKIGDVVEFDNIILMGDERIVPTQIVSGNPKNVGGGLTLDTESERADASALHPRTCIGHSITGDSIIMMVIDGRSSLSDGVRTSVLGDVMRWAKAYEAVNLDGGGSSTLYTAALGIRNHCSDGTGERAVGNGIFAVVEAPEDKEIAEIQFVDWAKTFPKYGIYTPKFYGYNKYGVMVDTDVQGVVLSCPIELGVIQNDGTTLFGNGAGTHVLTASYNGITASIPITIDANATPELKYTEVLLDNYRKWNIDVQALVGENYMTVDPSVLSWVSSNENIAIVDLGGNVSGIKNGTTAITGTIEDYTGTFNLTIECPESRVQLIENANDSASWKISKTGVADVAVKTLDNGLAFDYTFSSGRSHSIKINNSFRLWSLPDAVQLRLTPIGDATISAVTLGFIDNKKAVFSNKFETVTSGTENVITFNFSDFVDIEDIGIYPLTLRYIYLDVAGTEGTKYRIEMPGIEAVYNNAPSGIEDVYDSNQTELDVVVTGNQVFVGKTFDSIVVYDMAGKVVGVVENSDSIVISQAGAYIVKAIINGSISVAKVIL